MSMKKLLALALAAAMVFSIVACTPKDDTTTAGPQGTTTNGSPVDPNKPYQWVDDGKSYTYNTYTTVMPSNWNQLNYKDENDSTLISYFNSDFFTYDFKFDEDGLIIDGQFDVKYSAATKLEDVTAQYAKDWGLGEVTENYAYKITLRNDLKWDNGDPIDAHDFVYSMKEQLNPLFKHYRADSYYGPGSSALVGAQFYAKQGQKLEQADNGAELIYKVGDLKKGENGVYTQPDGAEIYFSLTQKNSSKFGKYDANTYAGAGYLDADAYKALAALADENGKIAVTDESIKLWEKLINTEAWGNEGPEEVANYWWFPYTYGEFSFDKVGIFAVSDYELVVVMVKPLDLLDDNGNLTYRAAYNFSSLPLVHEATFEACKQAPAEGSELWTTTYNTNASNTRSWGVFKLESFQSGKKYVCTRNTNWYGLNQKENEGLYMTDRIVCEKVENWNTAWLKFLAGEIDGIGLDVSVVGDYKGSSRAYFTPDDYVGSLQLQSNVEQLKARESEGVNKSILGYTEFRKALSLAINRSDYATKVTSASKAGYGLFGPVHYYDVEHGGVFRDTEEAKKILCDTYGVDVSKYPDLDAAVESISGQNLVLARQLVDEAYNKALAAGDIKAGDKVVLTYGTAADQESTRRQYNYLVTAFTELVKGTKLEGKLEIEFNASFGSKWADDFRAGAYDICAGGWSGAAWDPGYFLLAYLSPDYMYSAAWDTSSVTMKYTMKGVGENGADITEEMSLMDWYKCLNGYGKYDWSEAAIGNEKRLGLIAALEGQVLQAYYSVPLTYSYSASMLSYKIDYITYTYNTFMAYGGMKYMQYKFDDTEWVEMVKKTAVDGQLDYKA